MRDGHLFLLLLSMLPSKLPHGVAIDGSHGVVDGHARVAVEPVLPVEHDVHRRHDDAHEPQGDACLVFEVDIDQAENGRHNVEPMLCQEFHLKELFISVIPPLPA